MQPTVISYRHFSRLPVVPSLISSITPTESRSRMKSVGGNTTYVAHYPISHVRYENYKRLLGMML
jgi:hypothetical protein